MGFRFDRFATLYVAKPLHWATSSRRLSVPILMYHSISDDPETSLHPYYRTATSAQVFAAQMKYLYDNGYQTACCRDIVGQVEDHTAAIQKRVVITFDDGYRDFYTEAFPVLQRFGFSATVYLATAYIGDTPVKFKGKDCVTWAEARELNRHGVCFGSHTVTHPQLRDIATSALHGEIVDSKDAIEQKLSCPVNSFAYPYAFPETDHEFKRRLREMLSSAGYKSGVCTTIGRFNRNSDELFLRRLPVNSCDDSALFGAKLTGAYDWLGVPQYFSKVATSWKRAVH